MSCCESVCERGWKRVPVCACVCVWVVCLRERMIPSKILATNLSKQQCIKLVLKTIYLLAKQTKRQEHQQRDRQTESSISFKAKQPQYWIIKWRKSDWSEAGIFFGGETNYSLVSPIQKLSVEIPSQIDQMLLWMRGTRPLCTTLAWEIGILKWYHNMSSHI